MPIFTTTLGSLTCHSFLSQLFTTDTSFTHSLKLNHTNFPNFCQRTSPIKRHYSFYTTKVKVKVSVSGNANTENSEQAAATGVIDTSSASTDSIRQAKVTLISFLIYMFMKLSVFNSAYDLTLSFCKEVEVCGLEGS